MNHELTEEQYDLLVHLFTGGAITSSKPATFETYTLDHINLNISDSVESKDAVPATLFNSYRIYKSPERIRIEELERQIAKQQEVIQNFSRPKERHKRPHVTKEEVLAIEQDIDKAVNEQLIMGSHDISITTYHRIKSHTHRHSTPLKLEESKK